MYVSSILCGMKAQHYVMDDCLSVKVFVTDMYLLQLYLHQTSRFLILKGKKKIPYDKYKLLFLGCMCINVCKTSMSTRRSLVLC